MPSPTPSLQTRVAMRLAALRKEVGFTLRELGEKTELSEAYLSRVENGQTAVTLTSLEKLAEVYATPVASFFEDEEPPQALVLCRNGAGRKARFRGRNGTLARLLAEEKHGKLMEPIIVDVASSLKLVTPLGHPGEEFNYVIEGRCRFLFGEQTYILETGDAVYFDATVPHATQAIDKQPCQLLAVVTSRDFQIHRNISKVLEERIQA